MLFRSLTIRNQRSHLLTQSIRQLRNLRDSLGQRIARHYRPPAAPNGGVTVFDNWRIEEQIRAAHQLELWRTARRVVLENGDGRIVDYRRIEEQIRAVHQIELWRAAREALIQNVNCPTRPRFRKGLLTPAEEEHVLFCGHCQVTQLSIPFFEQRRSLRRLRAWRVNQVQRLSALISWHKEGRPISPAGAGVGGPNRGRLSNEPHAQRSFQH